jgi:hypothetical protein
LTVAGDDKIRSENRVRILPLAFAGGLIRKSSGADRPHDYGSRHVFHSAGQLKVDLLPFPQAVKVQFQQIGAMEQNLPAIVGPNKPEPMRVDDLVNPSLHAEKPHLELQG